MKYPKNWNPPLTIARRLIALPFVAVLGSLLILALLAGWGLDDAKRFMRELV